MSEGEASDEFYNDTRIEISLRIQLPQNKPHRDQFQLWLAASTSKSRAAPTSDRTSLVLEDEGLDSCVLVGPVLILFIDDVALKPSLRIEVEELEVVSPTGVIKRNATNGPGEISLLFSASITMCVKVCVEARVVVKSMSDTLPAMKVQRYCSNLLL